MFPPTRLVQIRNALELSQEGMARLLGVSFASVNRWENGHTGPSGAVFEIYRALDAALKAGKTSKQILGTEGDPGRLLHRIFWLAYGG